MSPPDQPDNGSDAGATGDVPRVDPSPTAPQPAVPRGMRVDVAAATDKGRVRQSNEDAVWAGDSVFAVADGMGGHAAGEIASATALEPVANLDGRVFGTAREAREALANAVLDANQAVIGKADADPSFRGMGTTLTAAMFEGRRLHVAHVGDSRAYLLRNGELSQLTTDHTLVQHLIDEGELTPEEAAEHPQRSVITRAIGVSADIEVDSLTITLEGDDQLLLCSDGLTGPVSDGEIARTVLGEDDADVAVAKLVEAANAAGGPDNITIVLLRFQLPAGEGGARLTDADHTGVLTPAQAPIVVRPDADEHDEDWADQFRRFGTRVDAPEDERPRVTPVQRATAVAIGLLVLLLGAVLGGRWLLSLSYYVGTAGDRVVIYQGIPLEIGPLDLSWVEEVTELTLDEVPDFFAQDLREGIPATDLAEARRIVDSAPRATPEEEPTPEPTGTPAPDGSDAP